MAEKLQLGALELETKKYTLPFRAEKGKAYICTHCEQKVILRKGKVRRAHFAHFSPTNTCSYYDHPNESQLHKDAKYKLAERLRDKFIINISNSCPKCTASPTDMEDIQIEYQENYVVIVEYRDPNNKYIADIAVLNNNKVRYIFEIKNTHATTTNVRPEPWFEINAEEIFEEEDRLSKNDPKDILGQEYYLWCIRSVKSRWCANCRIETESWPENIPLLFKKYGVERGWTQDAKCIVCNSKQYSPVFIKGFRQICKICIATDEIELRKKYEISICLIGDD